MKLVARLLMLLCAAFTVNAIAQPAQWPARPVRIIVPLPAGGSTMESVVRLLTQDMSKSLGRQVIVENRAGIIFTGSAQVDTAGFVATAAGMSNRAFMAGSSSFDRPARAGARERRRRVTDAGRAAALEAIATEIRACTRCSGGSRASRRRPRG